MRRLCWVVVVVFVLLTSMVGVAIFTGHGQSPATALQRFHLDDCLSPCVMGITLGKTTYNEALALFRQRQNGPGATAIEQIAPDVITLRMMDNHKRFVADEITVSFIGGVVNSVKIAGVYGPGNGVIPTLGDLVVTYGFPHCAQNNPRAGSSFGDITIINPVLSVRVVISGWYPMDWNMPVGSFAVFHYTPGGESSINACRQRWRGAHRLISANEEFRPDSHLVHTRISVN